MERVNVHLCLGAGTKPFSFVAEFESREDALLVVEFLQKSVKANGGFEAIGCNKAQFDFPVCVGISLGIGLVDEGKHPLPPVQCDLFTYILDRMNEAGEPGLTLAERREREELFRLMCTGGI